MTDAAIIRATYETYKHVPSRKVVQIVLEVPAEAQERLFKALGYPQADQSIWVAVARLADEATTPQIEQQIEAAVEEPANMLEPPANDDRAPRPLSQVSAILCGIVAFRRYLFEAFELPNLPTVDEAADVVRDKCGVRSRREFDIDDTAAANFRHLRRGYDAWMRAA